MIAQLFIGGNSEIKDKWKSLYNSGEMIQVNNTKYKISSVGIINKYPEYFELDIGLQLVKDEKVKMTIPHKHAEVIKAWADGAIIEVKSDFGNWQVTLAPQWNLNYEYRVKLVPKPVYPNETYYDNFTKTVLHNFIATGKLKEYVEKYGVDGLKGQ